MTTTNPNIKTYSPSSHKIKALIYGASGSGKTYFSGTAKNALYLSAENGLLSIKDKNPEYWEIKSFKDLENAYKFLNEEEHKYETVVLDSITEISDILKRNIEKEHGRTMQIQDWGEFKEKIIDQFRKFRDLKMHVIFIALDDRIVDEDKIHKIVPNLDGKAAPAALPQFMDIVGYTQIGADGKYWMQTNGHKKYITKNRGGVIGDDCPPDFEEWKRRVQEGWEIEPEKSSKDQLKELMDEMKLSTIENLNTILGTKLKSLDSLTDKQAENIIRQLKETQSNLPTN